MLAAGLPLFMLCWPCWAGSPSGRSAAWLAVTVASILVCGSLGSTLALWREKTFQALAMTVLVLVLWLALGEVLAAGLLGSGLAGLDRRRWAAAISPWQAILAASQPYHRIAARPGWLGSPVTCTCSWRRPWRCC